MNIKTFTIIAIASFAVLSVTACGGNKKHQSKPNKQKKLQRQKL